MIDPESGRWLPNVTCSLCKHRHPAEWTCSQSKAFAIEMMTRTAVIEEQEDSGLETLLSAVLQAWLKNQDLPQQCAEELYNDRYVRMTKDQRNWLFHYIMLWDTTQRTEK